MNIAIKYEKINLWQDMYVFKPVSLIVGVYDDATGLFETNYYELCAPIDGELKDEYSYYGNCITEDELLLKYEGSNLEEALEQYFTECCNVFTIAYFDYVQYKLNVLSIPYSRVQKFFVEQQTQFILDEDKLKVSFSIDTIKALRKIPELKELHERLDDILDSGKVALEQLRKMTTGEKITISEVNKKDVYEDDYYCEEENEYIDDFMNEEENSYNKITPKNSLLLRKEESKLMTLKELRKEVKDVIKGQDKAVDDVTRTIIMNQRSKNSRHKSHILIMGPSGTGKTEIVNIISKRLGIPYFKADATAYTKEGYVGKSVYSMLSGLITSVDGDVAKAQNGILIIDEIDKKLTSDEDWVGGVEVFNSLLKIMDRDIVEIDIEEGMVRKKILFDTSNLTIIFMGAFAKLYEEKEKKINDKKTIGFSSTSTSQNTKEKISLTNEDLIKVGMPPEFLGRIPVVTHTDELELEDLVEILYKSKGSAVEEEIEFCKDLGIELKFTNPYIREIAQKAKDSKTGARTLRKLVKESLACAYDEILSYDEDEVLYKPKVLKITKKTANDPKEYYLS